MNSAKLNKKAKRLGFATYEDYLHSPMWAQRKAKYASSHPKKCYVCHKRANLHLHHISYDNLGHELDSDLIWLCETHHKQAHTIKDISTAHVLLKSYPAEAVEQVKKWMESSIGSGIQCPCCDAYTKVYKRKLTSNIAHTLVTINQMETDEDGWVNIKSSNIGNSQSLTLHHGEYEKLPYWGLLERQAKGNHQVNKSAGLWRVTERGKQFVAGKVTAPKYVFVKHKKLLAVSEEQITLAEALGSTFNYNELMSEVEDAEELLV